MDETEEALQQEIADLLEYWTTYSLPARLVKPNAWNEKRYSPKVIARMQLIIGLSRHAHEAARAIRLLIAQGMIVQAVPLVRVAFECSIYAVHLMQGKDDHGVQAFLYEAVRTRLATQNVARKSPSAAIRAAAGTFSVGDKDQFSGSFDNMKNFGEICKDIDFPDIDAYLIYRALCNYSHAALSVVDLYLESPDDVEKLPGIREEPRVPLDAIFLLHTTAQSLVWCARAFSYMSESKEHRQLMRDSAKRLGTDSELKLNERYWLRHAKKSREVKAAAAAKAKTEAGAQAAATV
ncbi:DUF5677 domain-containing protein [Leucobacter sp. cx-169]|uniref:DUF5677 domain-containing protein n=1 Tax=Leucobacter sp. cx-169 TaxID=2770549 RepID=UPI00165E8BFC|nr:DUF5677 domain-containing protein [Leucobacter sp. cx-169]MBC9927376.1 hypothetical protein [Leucobacter sp. cx-169]